MLQVASPPAEGQLSLLINYHKNDPSCQYPRGTASEKSPACLPSLQRCGRPEGWHPGPFGSKIFFGTGRVLRTSTGARPARPERRRQTADAVSYLTSEVCPVMACRPGRDRQVCASGTSAVGPDLNAGQRE
jgi:hypothetical protein